MWKSLGAGLADTKGKPMWKIVKTLGILALIASLFECFDPNKFI